MSYHCSLYRPGQPTIHALLNIRLILGCPSIQHYQFLELQPPTAIVTKDWYSVCCQRRRHSVGTLALNGNTMKNGKSLDLYYHGLKRCSALVFGDILTDTVTFFVILNGSSQVKNVT